MKIKILAYFINYEKIRKNLSLIKKNKLIAVLPF